MSDDLQHRMERVEEAVWGNGREGLIVRLERIDGRLTSMMGDLASVRKRQAWVLGALVLLAGMIAGSPGLRGEIGRLIIEVVRGVAQL